MSRKESMQSATSWVRDVRYCNAEEEERERLVLGRPGSVISPHGRFRLADPLCTRHFCSFVSTSRIPPPHSFQLHVCNFIIASLSFHHVSLWHISKQNRQLIR